MHPKCSVGGCQNDTKDKVTLHKFPEDVHRCLLWVEFVQKSRPVVNSTLASNGLICSQHFSDDCFVSVSEIQLKDAKRLLTDDAVPSIVFSHESGECSSRSNDENLGMEHTGGENSGNGDVINKRTKIYLFKRENYVKKDRKGTNNETRVANMLQTHSTQSDSQGNEEINDQHTENNQNVMTKMNNEDQNQENDQSQEAEHEDFMTSVIQFSCLRCNEDFSSGSLWTEHVKTHTHGHEITTNFDYYNEPEILNPEIIPNSESETNNSERKGSKQGYNCDVCGKHLQYLSRFEQHRMIHTGEKPHFCEECGKSFTHSSCLTRHRVTHTKEKPFSCEKCERRFALQTSLRRHLRTHTGEKPYTCEPCGKSFTAQYSLHRHKLAHNGERPFGCHLCEKRFSQQCALTSHLRTKH